MSHENAKRYNKGKPDLSLLPRVACEEECRVWEFGAKKYGRDNWRQLYGDDTIQICIASLLRHALAIANGELTDKESGLSHAAHIRCNAAMILEYQRRKTDQDALVDQFLEENQGLMKALQEMESKEDER